MLESVEYKGYTIKIENDHSPINPFEEWNGLPSLLVNYNNCFSEYGSIDIDDILTLTREQIKNNFKAVQNVLCDHRPLLTILRTETYLDRFDNAIEPLNEYLHEFYEGLTKKDKLAMLSDFLTIKDVPHLLTNSYGYSQGDYVEMLLIADDSYKNEHPTLSSLVDNYKERLQKELQDSAALYSSWAWGDVYGFTVEDKEGDEIDSCWGFYGDNHEKSGLIEHAKNAIDCTIRYNRRVKLNKLKELIKNSVAIEKRGDILATL